MFNYIPTEWILQTVVAQ